MRMAVVLIFTMCSFIDDFFTMPFIVEFTMTPIEIYSSGEKLYKTIKYLQIDYNEQIPREPTNITFFLGA